jgi:hypothetical protein
MYSRAALMISIAIMSISANAPVAADDLMGLYAGGAVGQSDIRDGETFTSPFVFPQRYEFDEHSIAWKVVMGLRPIPLAGAEIEYIDFGHPHINGTFFDLPLLADTQSRSLAVFGVGYLPLPLPMLDFYAKVGVAALKTQANATNVGHSTCPQNQPCSLVVFNPEVFQQNETTANLAYGAGAQFKVAPLAIQLEYERINRSGGNPDLLSLGLTWSF